MAMTEYVNVIKLFWDLFSIFMFTGFSFYIFLLFFVFPFFLLVSLSGLLVLKKWKTFLTIITQKSCQHQPVKLEKFCIESTWPKIEEVSSFTKWMKTYEILQKNSIGNWKFSIAKFSSFFRSEEFNFSSGVILPFHSILLHSLRLSQDSHSPNKTGARWAIFACNGGWAPISTAQELFLD